jgi:hypothetical protein
MFNQYHSDLLELLMVCLRFIFLAYKSEKFRTELFMHDKKTERIIM